MTSPSHKGVQPNSLLAFSHGSDVSHIAVEGPVDQTAALVQAAMIEGRLIELVSNHEPPAKAWFNPAQLVWLGGSRQATWRIATPDPPHAP